jgi:hypothetical protein
MDNQDGEFANGAGVDDDEDEDESQARTVDGRVHRAARLENG